MAEAMDLSLLSVEHTVVRSGDRPGGMGEQALLRFPNGYGASIVRGMYTYGGDVGLFEVAVLAFEGDGEDDWHLTYETPVTDDVIGRLTLVEAIATAVAIAELPEADGGES